MNSCPICDVDLSEKEHTKPCLELQRTDDALRVALARIHPASRYDAGLAIAERMVRRRAGVILRQTKYTSTEVTDALFAAADEIGAGVFALPEGLVGARERETAVARRANEARVEEYVDSALAAALARIQELEVALREIGAWDMISPVGDPPEIGDLPWLRRVVDAALVGALSSEEEKHTEGCVEDRTMLHGHTPPEGVQHMRPEFGVDEPSETGPGGVAGGTRGTK